MDKTPQQLAESRIFLAEEYSRYSGDFAQMVKKQAEHFKANRDRFNSDKATERDFQLTEDGVRMTILKLKLKSIEKTMSAYNTYLRLMENQSKNLY